MKAAWSTARAGAAHHGGNRVGGAKSDIYRLHLHRRPAVCGCSRGFALPHEHESVVVFAHHCIGRNDQRVLSSLTVTTMVPYMSERRWPS